MTFAELASNQDYYKKPLWEFYVCVCSKIVVKSTVTRYPLYKAQRKKFILERGIRNKLKDGYFLLSIMREMRLPVFPFSTWLQGSSELAHMLHHR